MFPVIVKWISCLILLGVSIDCSLGAGKGKPSTTTYVLTPPTSVACGSGAVRLVSKADTYTFSEGYEQLTKLRHQRGKRHRRSVFQKPQLYYGNYNRRNPNTKGLDINSRGINNRALKQQKSEPLRNTGQSYSTRWTWESSPAYRRPDQTRPANMKSTTPSLMTLFDQQLSGELSPSSPEPEFKALPSKYPLPPNRPTEKYKKKEDSFFKQMEKQLNVKFNQINKPPGVPHPLFPEFSKKDFPESNVIPQKKDILPSYMPMQPPPEQSQKDMILNETEVAVDRMISQDHNQSPSSLPKEEKPKKLPSYIQHLLELEQSRNKPKKPANAGGSRFESETKKKTDSTPRDIYEALGPEKFEQLRKLLANSKGPWGDEDSSTEMKSTQIMKTFTDSNREEEWGNYNHGNPSSGKYRVKRSGHGYDFPLYETKFLKDRMKLKKHRKNGEGISSKSSPKHCIWAFQKNTNCKNLILELELGHLENGAIDCSQEYLKIVVGSKTEVVCQDGNNALLHRTFVSDASIVIQYYRNPSLSEFQKTKFVGKVFCK